MNWLENELIKTSSPCLVVSPHDPSERALSKEWLGHPLNVSFASNLEGTIFRHQPDIWIHGHTDRRADYPLGRTRVVSNPMGAPRRVVTDSVRTS